MIVIVCYSFAEAQEAFQYFLEWLRSEEPWCVRTHSNAGMYIETDDDLRYIFIDYHLMGFFEDLTPDIIDVNEFFDGITYFE